MAARAMFSHASGKSDFFDSRGMLYTAVSTDAARSALVLAVVVAKLEIKNAGEQR
jgi:hypothetical protein